MWRVLPRIFGQEGSQVQLFFSFEKHVFTHISCRDGAMVNTIFSHLRLEIVGFTNSLAKPVRESVPLFVQRFDSLSKQVTKHTRLDYDDDARSSQARSPNLNTRNYDSSSLSQTSKVQVLFLGGRRLALHGLMRTCSCDLN